MRKKISRISGRNSFSPNLFPQGIFISGELEKKVKDFFNIDKWQIGQPIVLADLAYQISLVEGVAAVVPPEEDNPNGHPVLITNKFKLGDGYSGNAYDIVSATRDGIVYPSLDPSIFELKFPNIDIEGRVVGSSAGGN